MTLRTRTLPTLFGAGAAAWTYVTVAVLLGHKDPQLGGGFSNWLIGIFFGSLLALAVTVACLGWDAVLHASRVLPEDGRAFASGAAALAGTILLYEVQRPGSHDGLAFWCVLILPIAVSALISRLVFSGSRR